MHRFFEFIFSLDRVNLEDLSRIRLALDLQNVLAVLALLAVIGVFGYWSYKGQSAAPGKKMLMGVIRGLVLMTLFFLCLRPHLVLEESKPEPSVIGVWIDDSSAMGIRDPYQDPALRAQAIRLIADQTKSATQPVKAKWPTRWDMAIDTLLTDKGLHQLAGNAKASATQPATVVGSSAGTPGLSLGKAAVLVVVFIVIMGITAAYLFSANGKKMDPTARIGVGVAIAMASVVLLAIIGFSISDKGGAGSGDQSKVNQEVAVFTGHDDAIAQGRATSGEQLDAILNRIKDNTPTGTHTDIPKVIKRIFSDLQGQPISSIILLTDGRSSPGHSSTNDATQLASAQRTPIFPIPIGSKEPLVNASLTVINVAEDVFVKVHVKIVADTPGKTKVTLFRRPTGINDDQHDEIMKNADGKDVTEVVEYGKGTTEKDVELIFKPLKSEANKSEVYHLVAKIDSIGEELSDEDNVIDAQTTVMDTKVNVLYVEGYPRWEFRYLKNELLREGTINVSTLLISADENFTQEGTTRRNPDGTEDNFKIQRFPISEEEMLKYDVVLIGDVEPAFFSPAQMKLLLDFVRKHGGGVGWIAGDQFNPDSYKGTALEPLLPIDTYDPKAKNAPLVPNEEFKVKATAEGMNSPLFRFFDSAKDNDEQMKKNPDMFWYKPVLGPHGPVQVLAEHPSARIGGVDGQNMPLLVYGQYGDGRVLYSGYADTWRWRRYKGEPLYQSYWLQVCRMLYAGRIMGQNHKVMMQASGRSATVNEPMPLTVTIHDPTMLPTAPSTLTIQVTDPNGNPLEPVVVSRVGENGTTYTGEFTSSMVGKIHLQVAPGSLMADPTPLELNVGRADDVDFDPTINMDELRVYAKETSGAIVEPSQTGELAKLVANKSIMLLKTTGEELWTKPFALVMLVLLLTAEWFIRKSSGLI